jgi:hypothetical protein
MDSKVSNSVILIAVSVSCVVFLNLFGLYFLKRFEMCRSLSFLCVLIPPNSINKMFIHCDKRAL